jgi:alanine-glyoxylate transaminase/serine-glyoxylate transaminase/serine-pyruvate transaminase
MTYQPGQHFLQLPGPTNCPPAVLQAIAKPTIDHRGPEFGALGREVLGSIKTIFKTKQPVIIYPASGTGAWEAALLNTLSPGDKILMFETGWFASLWRTMVARLGFEAEFISGDWRTGANASAIAARLAEDKHHHIKAIAIVHNETSTGVLTNIPDIRAAMDASCHPALLMVDTISSLASVDYQHDYWGVDVTIAGSQKGLMLPPGISFNAVSEKALFAARSTRSNKSYWDWEDMLAANATGYFPYTPNTNLLQGLKVAIEMLHAEGLEQVFARHERAATATRACVEHWGFEVQCRNRAEYSPVLTAVRMPEGHSADALRAQILARYNMSLGSGLGQLADRVFRIGHLGNFHDLNTLGTLAGVEMGLRDAAIPHRSGGAQRAIECMSGPMQEPARATSHREPTVLTAYGN